MSTSTRTRRTLGAAALAALALTLTTMPGASALGPAQQPAQQPAPRAHSASTINTASRGAVTAAWRAQWVPASHAGVLLSGGSARACTPFTNSASTQEHTRAAINFARGLAGLDPLTSVTDARLSGAAKSALIQAANDTLDHSPTRGMRCYTGAGAHAAWRSNLALFSYSAPWRPATTRFVANFLSDGGAVNKQVFHRRWMLRPQTTTMANAYAKAKVGPWYNYANDLYVFPSGTDNAHATKPKFIAWPSAGYFPTQLEPKGRWSLSSARAGISLKHARIKVTHHGKRVRITKRAFKRAYNGDRTIVWQLAHRPKSVKGSGVSVYKVTVTHISGAAKHTYKVRLFRP